MTTEHDEALVERVALALARAKYGPYTGLASRETEWHKDARAVIYPPAPPKTRLQVARELCSQNFFQSRGKYLSGEYDNTPQMCLVMTALALPQMED